MVPCAGQPSDAEACSDLLTQYPLAHAFAPLDILQIWTVPGVNFREQLDAIIPEREFLRSTAYNQGLINRYTTITRAIAISALRLLARSF